jgi:D-inositol-3-phosphate glycosyltransferase
MKKALVTLNIGNVLHDNSRASFCAAASRWDCDYHEVTECREGVHPHAMKLLVFELTDADRIFYIDADTVISAGCPSPFDVFPEDAFVACNNQQGQMPESSRNACEDTIARDLLTINQILGVVGPTYPKRFINSGVWLASRKFHTDVLKLALDASLRCLGRTDWKDQSALNHALIITRTPVYEASSTWNYQFPSDTGSEPMTDLIYHWAGGENRDQIAKVNWRSFHSRPQPKKNKLLVIADHICHTGFARVAENVCEILQRDWDLYVVGINYDGSPHSKPYPIWPARLGGDIWGIGTMNKLIPQVKPDAIFAIQDPWIAAQYATQESRAQVPIAAYMPIDARNQNREICDTLNNLDLAIFYTQFGERECRLSGYRGHSAIIPHGVDTKLYKPQNRVACRKTLGVYSETTPVELAEDTFIVGCVNRNQPRKRLDLLIQYFAEWINRVRGDARQRITNAYLYIHCSQRDAVAWDLAQLASYYGVGDRVILPATELVTPQMGLPEREMPIVYGSMDVHVSTSAGEGWGLSAIESAACGIPNIVPQFAALGEWMAGAAYMVPVADERCTHSMINTIGAVPEKEKFIDALDLMYKNLPTRLRYGQMALSRARESQFQWEDIGKKFSSCLTQMVSEVRARQIDATEKGNENGTVSENKEVTEN